MASSKLKKPPVLHQKRTTKEPANTENDLSVWTAFKKLKLDADGGCVKKTEDQSQARLKHKPDPPSTEEGSEGNTDHRDDKDTEAWSQSLQSFCLCEEGAITKKGRSKWKSMCRFHQLRTRKDSSRHRDSLNLAQAGRAHKPLVQEGRLKAVESRSPPQVLRSAGFSFEMKSAKLKAAEKLASESVGTKSVSEDSKSAACDKTSKQSAAATTKTHAVFAEAVSKHLSDFSSLMAKEKSCGENVTKEQVPSFSNFRERPHRRLGGGRGCRALWPEDSNQSSRQPAAAQTASSGAVVTTTTAATEATAAVPLRIDLGVERSCSQEARLDEIECGINELVGYFEHYFFFPKEMSSMAQMMYT